MQVGRINRAFSLLELTIVLVVMVGLMAVVWPNLQRPLNRTTLSEAAALVREAVDECRYQAAIAGRPMFVNFRAGQSEFYSGTFESFLDFDPDRNLMAGTDGATAPPASFREAEADERPIQPVRHWQLPPTVIVASVRWTLEIPAREAVDAAGGAAMDGLGDQSADSASTGSRLPNSDVAGNLALPGLEDQDRQWWLPLLATGRGRDATIELYDTAVQETLSVTYAAATGALEIVR